MNIKKLKDLKAEFTNLTRVEARAKAVKAYLKEKEVDLGKLDLRRKDTWLKIIEELKGHFDLKLRFLKATDYSKATPSKARKYLKLLSETVREIEYYLPVKPYFRDDLLIEWQKAWLEEIYTTEKCLDFKGTKRNRMGSWIMTVALAEQFNLELKEVKAYVKVKRKHQEEWYEKQQQEMLKSMTEEELSSYFSLPF